jgi:hypothetical protein
MHEAYNKRGRMFLFSTPFIHSGRVVYENTLEEWIRENKTALGYPAFILLPRGFKRPDKRPTKV